MESRFVRRNRVHLQRFPLQTNNGVGGQIANSLGFGVGENRDEPDQIGPRQKIRGSHEISSDRRGWGDRSSVGHPYPATGDFLADGLAV